MTGQELKNILANAHIQQSILADKLGMSKQSFGNILNKTEDVKTGLLERICVALGKDMSFFYPISVKVENNNTNDLRGANAHNISTGSGAINEQVDNSAINQLLAQNAALIELLKAKEGLK